MASSSSSLVHLNAKHDVFLSFRGEDTRDNITSHLYAGLCQKKIQTFFDEDGLETGDGISPALIKAVEESMISIIIFSKDYASSKWCLNELVKILECKEKNGQKVIPVFYQVDPSVVRKQTQSFGVSFVKHEKDFKKMPEKVKRWRAALTQAANLSGFDSAVIKPESKLVEEIVKEVLKNLKEKLPSSDYCKGLVGINSRMDNVKSLLCIGLLDFRVVGIWGMGGIGKTTIAQVLFDQIKQISNEFEGFHFIANVREEAKRWGLVNLRNEIISTIVEEDFNEGTPNLPQYIEKRLLGKKVFIVFDDIDDIEQLKYLIGGTGQFGPGSRIIITTRDKQVLRCYGVDDIYEVEKLLDSEALQLFCNYAFKKCPLTEFLKLSKSFVSYADGNPLALTVLGSSLYQRTKHYWESTLHKLKAMPNPKIYDVLKISYDGLDREEQDIFLDIACFFKGKDRNQAEKIFNSCYVSAHIGLATLVDKSVISISCKEKLEMHDLLQEMGWEIVRRESFKQLGKRSRLWNYEDSLHALKNNSGTEAVEGLFLDMSKIIDLELHTDAFKSMHNLKYLKFYVSDCHPEVSKVHLPQGLDYLSDELRYLYWHGYPLKALPPNFNPKNLVELHMPHSNVERLPIETMHGSNFKQITPYDINAPRLEHCQSLLVGSSMQYLTNLCVLNLSHCKSISNFPRDVHFGSLITLNLSFCSMITKFPQIPGNIKELYLQGTAIDEVPSAIGCLSKLVDLDLSYTAIKELPASIWRLGGLEKLTLGHCKNLETLPREITYLTSLRKIGIYGCPKLDKLPENTERLLNLETLTAYHTPTSQLPYSLVLRMEIRSVGQSNLMEIPESINRLPQLELLHLLNCDILSIPEPPPSLRYLAVRNYKKLQSLPLEPPPRDLGEFHEFRLARAFGHWIQPTEEDEISFSFPNCGSLDRNILGDLLEIIRHMATAAAITELCFEGAFTRIPQISLFLPGSDIPDSFTHKSSEPTITIELPQHQSSISWLIGFALSAVITLEDIHLDNTFEDSDGLKVFVNCYYRFHSTHDDKDHTDTHCTWSCLLYSGYLELETDHIALGYSPCMYVRQPKGEFMASSSNEGEFVTFKFSIMSELDNPITEGYRVKNSGVYPLYVKASTGGENGYDTSGEEEEYDVYAANISGVENGTGRSTEEAGDQNSNADCSSGESCLSALWCCDFVISFFRKM